MPVPEDIYKRDVDFAALALQYPEFSKRLKPNGQLDFSDPESVRQLTKALLSRDFGLTLKLPEDRLCPPVPNRFNYILYAQRLLDCTRPDYSDGDSNSTRTIGLDIGTGASAIYPLLASQQRPSWNFLATEIDSESRAYAERNIKINNLDSRVKLVDTDPSGEVLLPSTVLENFEDLSIRIQITNPPFYGSQEEMLASARSKSRPPNSACTGAPVEMITSGGEIQFVTRLIEESRQPANKRKIQWFSSMLGKLSSVSVIVERLRAVKCLNYAVTEFIQGQKTRRWCIAWSWYGFRPSVAVARGISTLEKNLLPFPTEFGFKVQRGEGQSTSHLGEKIDKEVRKLDLQWKWSSTKNGGIGLSRAGDVWSRKARRKREQQQQSQDEEMHEAAEQAAESMSDQEDEIEPALVFRITIRSQTTEGRGLAEEEVHVRWLQGQDSVLFESFCGWLKRAVTS